MPNSSWQLWKGIMKCYPFEEKRLAKWEPPYIVQPKYDGVRCRAVPTESGYILLSSEENVIFSVPHINEMFDKIFDKDLGVCGPELDGELYCHGKSFEEIVSITSRSQNIHSDYKCIQFHCFDIVIPKNQSERIIALINLPFHESLVIAPYYLCFNLEDILKVYDNLVSHGYEGIIVRHCGAFYERKRSIWVMKFKPKKEDSYEIIGFQEELDKEGLEKGSLGAIICESGDGNRFGVGTGFSAEQRQILWEVRDSLIGRITKVKYQHITSGNKVPRFPVFVEIV